MRNLILRYKTTAGKVVRKACRGHEGRRGRSRFLRRLQKVLSEVRQKDTLAFFKEHGFVEGCESIASDSVIALALAIADCPALPQLIAYGSTSAITPEQRSGARARFTNLPSRARLASPLLACEHASQTLQKEKSKWLANRSCLLACTLHYREWPLDRPPRPIEVWRARYECETLLKELFPWLLCHGVLGGQWSIEVCIGNSKQLGSILLMHVHLTVEYDRSNPSNPLLTHTAIRRGWQRLATRAGGPVLTSTGDKPRRVTPGTEVNMARYTIGVQRRGGFETSKVLDAFDGPHQATPRILAALLANYMIPFSRLDRWFGSWNGKTRAGRASK
ncbi:MAG: hypothetical protein U0638_13740 [Phycisphaerales bacterium]